jgi:hypothetical protein
MVAAERAPDDEEWFCTVVQQWHLNSCMETSYDTIPWWLRGDIDRCEYYNAYRHLARGLVRPPLSVFDDGRPYCALHARRTDRGRPGDDQALREIVSALAPSYRDWVVVSDDPETTSMLGTLLRAAQCTVADLPDSAAAGSATDPAAESRAGLIQDFTALVGARAIVCSVRYGWSAFPYAATRISGAPLVLTEPLERSTVWRLIRAHSRVPVRGVHHGPVGVLEFLQAQR